MKNYKKLFIYFIQSDSYTKFHQKPYDNNEDLIF